MRRSYTVREKDDRLSWSTTDSFGRDDLLSLAKAVDLAHTWIHRQAAVKVVPRLWRPRRSSAPSWGALFIGLLREMATSFDPKLRQIAEAPLRCNRFLGRSPATTGLQAPTLPTRRPRNPHQLIADRNSKRMTSAGGGRR